MKILVFGASGQLGTCLKKVAAERNLENVTFLSQSEGNILDADSLQSLFSREQPEVAINCAAYTAVDKAEDEPEACRKLNATGPQNLAKACKAHGTTVFHISTDFVFQGDLARPLLETDATDPLMYMVSQSLKARKRLPQSWPATSLSEPAGCIPNSAETL